MLVAVWFPVGALEAARPIGVRRTTFQPVSLLSQETACNARIAFPDKTGNCRNSLLVNLARIVGSHVGVATLHGHLLAQRLVLASLLNGVLDRLFAASLVVATCGAFEGVSHFDSFQERFCSL